ncbi:thioredoxin family protein [Leucothrix pacifica]|uniref:Thioredoxin family protein n=1 Tax=Leucothrix pacifica TaxID=1247513 RepID=A0A317CMY2_9GAMM|nr:thioredoxin family protein [Leucothrix pacifica]PWQ99908.1 thioredoxin family protein [Leucothrix pacifica]
MARTPSTMLALGTKAPDFSLPEPLTGKRVSLNDFEGKPLLVVFTCNHCPYVINLRASFTEFVKSNQAKGLAVVAINSNDVENYPADSPEKMVVESTEHGFTYPYLYDEDQQVAAAYQAACTPDFFLFDSDKSLYYRGQYDDSRPGNGIEATGKDMQEAVDQLLAGHPAPSEQKASLGCGIKWKSGNEPTYG